MIVAANTKRRVSAENANLIVVGSIIAGNTSIIMINNNKRKQKAYKTYGNNFLVNIQTSYHCKTLESLLNPSISLYLKKIMRRVAL